MNTTATILLVEDNAAMRSGIAELLAINEFDCELVVKEAVDGQEALDVLADSPPDLIISDIMMPRVNGFELLDKVRKNPAWIQIPFIFLTARGSEEDELRGRSRGADRYIIKPFETQPFLELVQSQLKRLRQIERQREASMQELQKSILQLLNHEFRTPLTYVTAYYEMMADSLEQFHDRRQFQDHLQGIQAGCIRLSRLAEDFIYVLELRTGEIARRYESDARPIPEFATIVHAAETQARLRQPQTPVTIEHQFADDLPVVFGLPDALQLCISHLIENGIKFAHYHHREAGEVVLTLSAESDTVALTISDNGIGFPERVTPRLYDIFYQYNRGQFEQQGAGIGLSIVKGLLDLHGGQLEVHSVEGEGSTFTMKLPTYAPAISAEMSPSPILPDRTQATLLLVEDDSMLLLTLSEMLSHADSRYDYRLITASNGEEALQQMYQELPDLVLSDIMMPLVDGYAFLETVRQHPEWLHIPILFVTAKNSPQDKHEGLTKGVEEYVTKPYRASELVTLIDKQLDRYFAAQNDVQADFETLKRNILRMLPANFALPLNDVTAYSEQLATSMADIQTEDALKEALFGIQQSSAGLTMLIEDFIALAELRTGETENAFSQRAAPIYDAGLIPFEACHRCSESARALGAEVSVPEIRDLPPIYGDMGLLLPVIERLAQLSLSYYPHGEQRQVGIDTSYSAEVVRFHLSFGFGVSAEDSAIIQTILQSDSLDQTRLSEFAPSLTIANAYIQLHKGRICFNDRSPAEFEFTIELPRAAPP